ncbi:MAG: biopolymer transporter ExbD [Gemmatales bacterium]|nr:MAG: biopolymer transporter ExbD [Gemmatales bacterium]
MRIPTSDSSNADPNLTPMIDVVFLLLIFFLVATRFEKQEFDQTIALAEVAFANESLASSQTLVINVTKDGHYKVMQKKMSEDLLLAFLKKTAEVAPHKQVLIRADGRAAWRFVARPISLCQKTGLKFTCRVEQEV